MQSSLHARCTNGAADPRSFTKRIYQYVGSLSRLLLASRRRCSPISHHGSQHRMGWRAAHVARGTCGVHDSPAFFPGNTRAYIVRIVTCSFQLCIIIMVGRRSSGWLWIGWSSLSGVTTFATNTAMLVPCHGVPLLLKEPLRQMGRCASLAGVSPCLLMPMHMCDGASLVQSQRLQLTGQLLVACPLLHEGASSSI